MSRLDYDVEVDVNEVQACIDLMAHYGCIPNPFNASLLLDLRFLGGVVEG